MTMSAVDFLDQWFETDVLKATMSASGIIGTFLGVRSPGTAYVLLHHYMGEIDGAFRSWGFSRGGTGAISERDRVGGARSGRGDPDERSGRAHPIEERHGDRRGADERRRDRRDAGAVERRSAPDVPEARRRRANCRGEFVEDVRRYKFRGSSGKVNLALDALPNFTSLPGPGPHLRGAISISPSVDHMERAYDQAKYGEFSRRPYIDMVIPTLTDPSVAPPGKHILSCFVQYAPYHAGERHLGRAARGVRRRGDRHASPSTRPTSATSSCTARS